MQLANFNAEIIEDIREDDGLETRRAFKIQAELLGSHQEFTIPAAKFAMMNWPTEHLGAAAIVNPGFGTRDHARAAIQNISTNIVHRTVYKHIGWKQINGEHVYLHGGGAIGRGGPVDGVEVVLTGDLSRYELPDVPPHEELIECIRHSLRLRELAPRVVTCCLEGAAFRAPLGADCDSTVWLTGETGSGKSELTARYQQHFGSKMDRKGFPGNWSSTGNSLEASGSLAKDALFVVDDFCPRGTAYDVARFNQLADRVIRSTRNKAGRGRMWSDGNLRPTRVPQCVIVGTGEDIPTGHSLRASMMIVELSIGEMDWQLLSECTLSGADAVYAKTMAGYLRYIARHYEEFRDEIQQRFQRYRAEASASASHKRTPELVANLALGCWFFLRFARATRAITSEERNTLFDEAWAAIGEAAEQQEQHQRSARPELRFLQLLCSALGSGEVHLTETKGGRPLGNDVATTYGWQRNESRGLSGDGWVPKGKKIGWVDVKDGDDSHDIYLDPEASYKAAQNMAQQSERITVAEKTLRKRLSQAGLLASTDKTRDRLTVRKQLQGKRRAVLHIHSRVLCQE